MAVDFLGRFIPDTLQELVEPRSTAVVVWDVTNGIVAEWGGEVILKPLAALLKAARQAKVPVVYAQQTIFGLDRESPAHLRWIAKRMGVPVGQLKPDMSRFTSRMEGSKEWQIHDAVRPTPKDTVFRKYRELPTWLQFDILFKSVGARTVVITGLTSCGGIYPTARCMSYMEYYPVVVRDCIYSKATPLHEAALKLLADQFDLVDSSEIVRLWDKS